MKNKKLLTKLSLLFIFLFACNLFWVDSLSASGISADAGLTPAANRWIFKTQFRLMQRDNHPTMNQEMTMQMYPVVIAYGLKSNIALMVRQAFVEKEMTMMGKTTNSSGFGDLLFMAKYRLVRVNKPTYTFGIAPTIGIELPTGNDAFSSNGYDLRFGTYFSGRRRRLSMDVNMLYIVNGIKKESDVSTEIGNEFSMVSALGYQISMGSDGNFSFTPVIESSYLKTWHDTNNGINLVNTGESLFLLSPGFKITKSSIIFESLFQIPVWQEQNGLQTERTSSFLIGIRIMN